MAGPASAAGIAMTPDQAKASYSPRVSSVQTQSQPTGAAALVGPSAPGAGSVDSAIGSLLNTTKQNMENQQDSSFNSIKSDVSNAADDIQASKDAFGNGNVGEGIKQGGKAMIQGELGTVSDAISYFLAPLSASVKTVTDTVAGNNPNAIGGISDIPAVQNFASGPAGDALKSSQDALSKAAQTHPVLAKALTDAYNVVATAAGGNEAPEALDQLGQGVSKDVSTAKTAASSIAGEASNIASDAASVVKSKVQSVMPESKPPTLDEGKISDAYNRAIKPSVRGKVTASQVADSNARAVSGLKAIADNKANLEFTDADGNVIKGQTPTTVDQLSQAVQQTKESIFKQYDALAKQAGQKGISVDPTPIATELSQVINSKSLKLTNPGAIKYAQDLQSRLLEQGPIDAETAQEVIKNYNDELKAYYRNPTPGLASNVQIDAMVANRFRTSLDDGITNATGQQYQSLKNQYGALASMEKDITNRNIVWGRQNQSGFAAGLSNMASGAELVRGLLTANPVDMVVGGTIKGLQLYNKYLNNPDVGVSNIFNEFNRAGSGQSSSLPSNGTDTGSQTTPSTQPQGKSGTSENPTTFQPKSKLGNMIRDASKNGTQKGMIRNPLSDIQRDNVVSGLSKLKSSDFVNKAGKLNSDAFSEAEDISDRAEKGKDTPEDIRRGQEILALLKKTK